MATLWIREYASLPRLKSGAAGFEDSAMLAQEPGTDQTPVTFSTTTPSSSFGTTTTYIAMIASAAFHYVVANAPVATTNHLKVPADTLIYIGVQAGMKIAAIAAV